MKQIFPDTARQPRPPAHIKDQTDERISQTIFRILSNLAKRDLFPGFPARHLDRFDAPGEEQYCLGQNRLYKPHESTTNRTPKQTKQIYARRPEIGTYDDTTMRSGPPLSPRVENG